MTYLSESHARFAHAIASNPPPKLPLYPSPSDFDDAMVAHVTEQFAAIRDYISALRTELRAQHCDIDSQFFDGALSDYEDEIKGALRSHADQMQEVA